MSLDPVVARILAETPMVCVEHPRLERAVMDHLEFGDRVAGALHRENTGYWWARRFVVGARCDMAATRRVVGAGTHCQCPL